MSNKTKAALIVLPLVLGMAALCKPVGLVAGKCFVAMLGLWQADNAKLMYDSQQPFIMHSKHK